MPIYLRRYSISRINKRIQEEQAEYDKAMDSAKNSSKSYKPY